MKDKKIKKTKGKYFFWKILGAVILIWAGVSLIKPIFKATPYHLLPNNKMMLRDSDFSQVSKMASPNLAMMEAEPVSLSPKTITSKMKDRKMTANDGGTISIEKRVTKNGVLNLKVDSIEESTKKIKEIAEQYKGEVVNVNINRRPRKNLEGHLTVRVPVQQFETAFQTIKKVGDQVLFESISADDVTEEYVDLQAQIKNKKAEEDIFRKLLEQSGRLEDVLKVTREVARVRGEIDRLEGRIKFMESRTDLATIQIVLVEYEQISSNQNVWKPLRVAQKAIKDLMVQGQQLIDMIIYFIIVQLPMLLAVALILYFVFKGLMKIFNKLKK